MPFPHPVPVVKPRGVPERPSAKKRAGRALVLAAMPGTARLIRRRTRLGQATISRWLSDLSAAGDAHISHWRRTTGRVAAVWAPGPGVDAEKLRPLSHAARTSRLRARERAAVQADLAERAARLAALVPRRDPLVAAFFGSACAGRRHDGAQP